MGKWRTGLTPIGRGLSVVVAGLLAGCASAPRVADTTAAGLAATPGPETSPGHHHAAAAGPSARGGAVRDAELTERWGIEVTSARLTAHGHMVDFRYRVLDADKAAPLFERQTKPNLIHEGSGKVLAVPQPAKTGALRNSSTPQAGKIYWMFFGNAGKLVQPGDRVTVVIGDFRLDQLVVE